MTSVAQVQVWIDTVGESGHRGLDLRGQRFGELTAIRAVDRRDGSMVWLCRCDCGRIALRTATGLRQAVRAGETPMCLLCLRELRRGSYIARHSDTGQHWLRVYVTIGSLYGEGWAERQASEIVDDLELVGWPRPDEPPPPALTIADVEYDYRSPGQRFAYLVPIGSAPGCVWNCYECGADFRRGFACLACDAPACWDCIADEAHRCPESNRMEWVTTMCPERLDRALLMQVPGKPSRLSAEERRERRKVHLMDQVRAIEDRAERQKKRRIKYLYAVERRLQQASDEQLRRYTRRMKKRFPALLSELQKRTRKETG